MVYILRYNNIIRKKGVGEMSENANIIPQKFFKVMGRLMR